MRVLAHADPHVLEAELLERIEAAQRGDPFAPVLVVVPTVRLAGHVRRRIVERLGTRLAVEVLHHRALAGRIVEEAEGGRPEVATPALLEALLRSVLDTLRGNDLARFVREHPGALRSLLLTLRDLREAGVAPADTNRLLSSGRGPDLAAIHAAYLLALEAREAHGLRDDAMLAAAAAARAAAFSRRFRAILHHGAYELVGIWLGLARALDEGAPSTWLLPFGPGTPSGKYGERFARRHLLAAGEALETVPSRAGGLLGSRVAALYDEGARLPSRVAGEDVLATAQGAVAEADMAARLALRASSESVAPQEIALIARSLTPYAAALESVIEPSGIAWDADLRFPLRREPPARDFLALLRAAVDDFPRPVTAEMLRSPRIRWQSLLPDVQHLQGELAEPWSRRAGVVGGVQGWVRDLPAWAAAPHVQEDATEAEHDRAARRAAWRLPLALALGRAVEAVDRVVEPHAVRRWSGHAEHVERLVRDLIVVETGGGDAVEKLFAAAGHLRQLETRAGLDRPVPFADALGELERVVNESTLPLRGANAGGLRVLDVAQARGLTFDRVFLLGMNAGLFPRAPREDPFLGDDARALLREATGRPMAVKREAEDEERLLLAMVLASARESIHVSWQRADEEGKAMAASPALREVARVLVGEPDAARLRESAFRIAAHPAQRIEDFAERAGMLRPDEALLRSALAGGGNDGTAAAMVDSNPDLASGIEMLRATESFAPGAGRYDGRTGIPPRDARPRSVTSLEKLGTCPLQYFFRHRLGVYPLDTETSPFGLEPADLGTEVHAVLETLYRRLEEEGLFATRDAAAMVSRAEALFEEIWRETLGSWGERMRDTLPLLHDAETERWRTAVLSFVREDLGIVIEEGRAPRGFEVRRAGTIEVARGRALEIEGRFDRVFLRDGTPVVADYKTRGKLKERVAVSALLRGRYLQAPLYRLLAGDGGEMEILGVGPDFLPDRTEARDRRAPFRGFDAAQDAGFRETLAVLLDLDLAGRFPLRHGDHCRWCDYRSACRRNHPPTRERESLARDGTDFRDVGRKSLRGKLYTLADVRGVRSDLGEDE